MLKMYSMAILVAAAVLSPHQKAFAYSQLVVFGDSFSDTGNVFTLYPGTAAAPNYYMGRFSNGPNYVDALAAGLGLRSTASLLGGTNFAYGAADTSPSQPPSSVAGVQVTPAFTQQLATYFASTGGAADPDALYVVQSSLNDVLGGLRALTGTDGSAAASYLAGIASTEASNIASIENQLVAAGARNLLTLNVPNLALEPVTQASGYSGLPNEAALAGAAAQAANAGITSALGASPPGVRRSLVDLYALTSQIVSNPSALGFTSVSPCNTGIGNSAGTALCMPGDQDNHVFFDTIHYSSHANGLFAAAALQAVPEPASSLALLGIGLVSLMGWRRSA